MYSAASIRSWLSFPSVVSATWHRTHCRRWNSCSRHASWQSAKQQGVLSAMRYASSAVASGGAISLWHMTHANTLKCVLQRRHISSTLQPRCSMDPQRGVSHNSGLYNFVLCLTNIQPHLAHLFPSAKVAFKNLEWALYFDLINPLTVLIAFALLIEVTATPNLLATISKNCSQPIKSANRTSWNRRWYDGSANCSGGFMLNVIKSSNSVKSLWNSFASGRQNVVLPCDHLSSVRRYR